MKGFMPLLKKELKEQIRGYRLVIVAGVFGVLGLSTPFLIKYLPEIIRLTGQTVPVDTPPATALTAFREYSETVAQLGVLVVVLLATGAVSGERSRGTAAMTLAKPVSRSAFLLAKGVSLSVTLWVSLGLAWALCLLYTRVLFQEGDALSFLGLNLLLGLFLTLAVAVTLLYSTWLRSQILIALLSLVSMVGTPALGAMPVLRDYTPGALIRWGNSLLEVGTSGAWGALAVTLLLIVSCQALSIRLMRRQEL
ncbi:MAG: ABC transporter permease subunit [Chloroflexi bacterium]|nr:ABC transporter permease subunit [Chloroflexota bacterium]